VVPGGQDCLTWAEARDFAATVSYQGMQGHLATITSADEDTFVKNYLLTHLPLPTQEQERYVWIGGYQLNNQSGMNTGWRWTTGEAWTYTGWNPGEPNDCCTAGETNEENCLEHHYKLDNGNPILGWNDDGCGSCRYYFLIEFEPAPESVPTLNQYGMVVFILLIGLAYIFYPKRRQKTGA
jgi:hypothetical protein